MTTPIPPDMWLPVAQSIAYDDGFGHEVVSYDEMTPGEHNSSFSPEDLCSNKLGTRIGAIALRSPDPFDQAVTQALAAQVFAAGGVSKPETMRAFGNINHCWVEFKDWTSGLEKRLSTPPELLGVALEGARHAQSSHAVIRRPELRRRGALLQL